MKAFTPVAVAVLFAVSTVAVEPVVVNNVAIGTTCEPLMFTWSGGTPPYELNIAQVISDNLSQDVELLPSQNGTSFSWVVDIAPAPGGESLTLEIFDAAGSFGRSAPFEIQDSTDHSCLTTLVVATPANGTVCEPLTLSWSGGNPPYTVSIAQLLSSTAAVPVRKFATQTPTFIDWLVDITPITGGDTFIMEIVDGMGVLHESARFNIQDSTDHVCIPFDPSVSVMGISPTSTTTTFVSSPSTVAGTQVESTSKSGFIGEGKILGIGLGLLAALLLLALWRVYVLRTRRRRLANRGDTENLGLDQKIPLSPIQKHFT